ncbi:MAG TPA: hypothetical protein VHB47_09835 [Thermoanaerobaculia bacterium]|jgi:hypothetical protein|nr:hypothetical protein [Thermoanaerobaculia bacterium]
MDLRQLAAWAPHERHIGGTRVRLDRGDVLLSLRQAATRWRWSTGRIQRFLRILIEMGYLTKQERTADGDIYHLETPETSASPRQSSEDGNEDAAEDSAEDAGETQSCTITTTSEKEIEPGNEARPSPSAIHEPSERAGESRRSRDGTGFDEWLAAYPPHRRENRSRAQLAWDATEDQRPPLAAMLATLEVQRRSRRWHSEGGRFVPAAWNYLQQARWADDWSAYPPVEAAAAEAPREFDPPGRLGRLAAALPPAFPDREIWVSRIAALAGEPAAIEDRLAALDRELLAAAADALDPEQQRLVAGAADRGVAAVAGRLTPSGLGACRDLLCHQSIRDLLGLPVLSLFSPEAD